MVYLILIVRNILLFISIIITKQEIIFILFRIYIYPDLSNESKNELYSLKKPKEQLRSYLYLITQNTKIQNIISLSS